MSGLAADPTLAARGDELAALDRLARLGGLVAGVAHEINSPITYVLGNLAELEQMTASLWETLAHYREIVLCEAGERARGLIEQAEHKLTLMGGPELTEELVSDALDGGARIRELVRTLLRATRPDPTASEPLDVHALIDQCVRLSRHLGEGRVELSTEYTATRPARGDRAALSQVLLNLIQNAIQACRAGHDGVHRVHIRTRDAAGGDRLRVEVEDTGVGIPERVGQRVFAPFFTTKPPDEGSGLGLHISRELVEGLGGRLDFRSGRCQGTVFTIDLPYATAGGEPEVDPARSTAPHC